MNNYSDYHLSFNDKIIHDGKKVFELAKKGIDGFTVNVDGKLLNVVIQEKFQNPNGDLKYIMADIDSLKIGSVIEHLNTKWLLTTLVKDNPVYQTGIMQMCNNQLKWGGYSYPCILTTHSIGEEENKFVVLQSSQLLVYVQANEPTSNIKPEQRFVFGDSIYRVIGIDNYSKNGILIVSMALTTKSSEDNFDLGIADNSHLNGGSWL